MDIESELKTYLTQLAVDAAQDSIEPEDDLIGQGVIDSVGLIKLVEFVEQQFGIKLDDEEIVPENFQSLRCLSEFVRRKKGAG